MSYDFFEIIAFLELLFQNDILCPKRPFPEGIFHYPLYFFMYYRLDHIVVSPRAECADSCFYGSVSGDHNDDLLRRHFFYPPQQLNAVNTRKDNVCYNKVI